MFVSRKVTAGVACIKNGVQKPPMNEQGEALVTSDGKLEMGDLSLKRDWGYAKEYVEAMYLMLQHEKPMDYVIGTNTTHTIEELCQIAFEHVGLNYKDHVISSDKFYRPTEIKELKGDYTRAKTELGWEPRTSFEDLVKLMVDADLERFK